MHDSLSDLQHRPYPPPTNNWIMQQSWHDLLFAHWRFPVESIRHAVPKELPIDTHDGTAWVAAVPFRIENLRARGLPAFHAVSKFPELNLRTYVTIDGKPGVYFFSLDAGSKLAVRAARALFHLNYYDALMSVVRGPRGIEYLSRRTDQRAPPVDFTARYRADGKGYRAERGTLEYFLVERYCLYAVSRTQQVSRLEIHHRPWLLQPAEAEIDATSLFQAARLPAPSGSPLLHFSGIQEMVGWWPEKLRLT